MSDSPGSSRIYLDNAATSWPKPAAVCAAVDAYQRACGAAVGRGATRRGMDLQRIVDRCRARAARLLGAESPERIVFTFNGTDGLNLALHGLLRSGDHVVTSVMEHNSVLRPLRTLQERDGVQVDYVAADEAGVVRAEDIRAAVTSSTRAIVLVHASNVTGAIQPAAEAGAIARECGALFVLDAAQSAGHVPIDVNELQVDVLACSGHKGLLGPLGTGLVYVRAGIEKELEPLKQGGTGSNSEDDHQPAGLPDRFESGNHNAPGLVGLEASLAWIEERGVAALREHEQQLTESFLEGLRDVAGVRVFGPESLVSRTGVVSVQIDGFDPQTAAAVLDEHFDIEVRAGLHCAPRAHRAIGTFDRGGTVRFSVGAFTTTDDIVQTLASLETLRRSS
jgi:cysteine desulfurase family protein